MPTDLEAFGAILRQRRRIAKKTQREVAAECGFSSMFLSDVERGRRRLPLEHFSAIASSLHVAESWLLKHAGYCPHCGGTGER